MIEYLKDSPLKESLIFDSHAHYDDSKFDDIREEVLSSLQCHGVSYVVNCGCDKSSSEKSLSLAEKYEFLYAAVGLHPENLDKINDLTFLNRLLKHKKCVAIGEIGLDYYWKDDNKEEQKDIFLKQIKLSKENDLPVIVHDRDAHGDMLDILKQEKPKGVVHSFSGSPEMAEEIFKIGMYIGIGGTLTFKNARKLPDVVKMMPLDRFLLETDCPYLAPDPYRSKINNSAMIYLTAKKISEIKNIEVKEILKISKQNSLNLFKKIKN